MVDLEQTSDETDELRRSFYRHYFSIEDLVRAEGWNFNEKTIYSKSPSIEKNITENKKISIVIMVSKENISVISYIQNDSVKSSEFDVLHQSRELEPVKAAEAVVHEFIPKYEDEFFN